MPRVRSAVDRSLIARDRRAWSILRGQILVRDGGRCVRCGATPAVVVDHVIPRSAGGSDHPSNLRSLCCPCDRRITALQAEQRFNAPTAATTPAVDSQRPTFPVHHHPSSITFNGRPLLRIVGNSDLGWLDADAGCPPSCALT